MPPSRAVLGVLPVLRCALMCRKAARLKRWAYRVPMRSLSNAQPITGFAAVHALARLPIGDGGTRTGGGRAGAGPRGLRRQRTRIRSGRGGACVVPPRRRAPSSIFSPSASGLSGSVVIYPFCRRSPGGARGRSLRFSAGRRPCSGPPADQPPLRRVWARGVARARAVPWRSCGRGFART